MANHPLLIRSVFDDEKVAKMAEIASAHGLYGGNCSYDRVHKELLSYSDHQLHQFASEPCNCPCLQVSPVTSLTVHVCTWSVAPVERSICKT